MEPLHVGEEPAAAEQRHDLPLVPRHQVLVGPLVLVGALVFHPVALGVALHLPVAEHGQPGQGGEQQADPEVLVVLPELRDRGLLVGIVHEVHVPFEDLRIELQRVLDGGAVAGVVLLLEHVHEGGVVDPVHAQGADEVALHHPEGLGEQQRVWHLARDAIDDLAPELHREELIEPLPGHRVLRARGDVAARAGNREPEALVVSLGQRHGRVESDDGEEPRDVEDGLEHGLAHLGLEVVELRGVVPRHAGAVVAVIEEPHPSGVPVGALEHHRRVGLVPVAVLDLDPDARVVAQVGAVEGVAGERRVIGLQEPVGVLDHPAGIDAHVVGHHVARQPDAAARATVAKVLVGGVAAQLGRDLVVVERVSRGCGVGVAVDHLDRPRRLAPPPQADQPERRVAALGQHVELGVGDVAEGVDGQAVLLAELVEPDEAALGQHHHPRHPVEVGAEALGLLLVVGTGEHLR